VPRAWGFWSARRYLSLYRPGGAEDVFPYYRPARWAALGKVRVPLAVIIGGRDEYLDRSPSQLIAAFALNAPRAPSISGIVVPGARHGFRGHEAALAREIVGWVRRVR
jgi:pimeloyl-ACP methyl ester carboxylesterase